MRLLVKIIFFLCAQEGSQAICPRAPYPMNSASIARVLMRVLKSF